MHVSSGLLRFSEVGIAPHHDEGPLALGEWNWEPSVVVGLALFVGLYLLGIGPLRRLCGHTRPATPGQVLLFLAGSLVLLLTLTSPLDTLGDRYLFSAHMAQHILLTGVVSPILLLGVPAWFLRPLVKSQLLRLARFLTHPVSAFAAFYLTFAAWHLPLLYELALADERIHALEHLTFLVTAVISWWPVVGPLREVPRLSRPGQLLYLFANCQPGVVFGAAFVFSRDIVYRSYADAPRLFGISAYTDQQLGGLIMWIPGSAVYLVALSIVFLRWMQQEEAVRPAQSSVVERGKECLRGSGRVLEKAEESCR